MNASEDLQQFQLAKLQLPNMRFRAGRGSTYFGVVSSLMHGKVTACQSAPDDWRILKNLFAGRMK
jgi:hypothetical protein